VSEGRNASVNLTIQENNVKHDKFTYESVRGGRRERRR
jgi:hypothetical protein